MKKIFIFLIIAMVFNIGNARAEDLEFTPALTDVPAFNKIEFYYDSIMEFDSAWGSIIEIEGRCNCSCKEVDNYYSDIMPNLGWKKESKDSYIRDSLSINIETNPVGKICEVSFSETH